MMGQTIGHVAKENNESGAAASTASALTNLASSMLVDDFDDCEDGDKCWEGFGCSLTSY
jgi:hypothetical protein